METIQDRTIKMDVLGCARCGQDHYSLDFKPIAGGNPNYDYWTLCPVTGEPIMMKATEQAPVVPTYSHEDMKNADELIKKVREGNDPEALLSEQITQEVNDLAVGLKQHLDAEGELEGSYDVYAVENGISASVTCDKKGIAKMKKMILAYDPSIREVEHFLTDQDETAEMQSGTLNFIIE